jgi:hypothetical protein
MNIMTDNEKLDVNTIKEINIEENGSIWFSLEDVHTGGRIPVSNENFINQYRVL